MSKGPSWVPGRLICGRWARSLAPTVGTCPGPGLETKAGGGAWGDGRVRGGARARRACFQRQDPGLGACPGRGPGGRGGAWPSPWAPAGSLSLELSEARWLSPSRPSSAIEGSGSLPAAGRPFLGPTWWEARAGSAAGIRSPGSWRPSVWPGSSQERGVSWREGLEGLEPPDWVGGGWAASSQAQQG